jgi:hypothetical protein
MKNDALCLAAAALEDFRGGEMLIGDDPPGSAPWGYCDRDYPREAIVSPFAVTLFTSPMDLNLCEW